MTYSIKTKFGKAFINKLVGYDIFDEEWCYPASKVCVDREWNTIDVMDKGGKILKSVRYC